LRFDAAGVEAERLGYSHAMLAATSRKARQKMSAANMPSRRAADATISWP